MSGVQTQYDILNNEGRYKELFEYSEQNLDSGLEAKYWRLHALWRMGNLDEALETAKEYESEFVEDKQWNTKFLSRFSGIYTYMGEYDLGLRYCQRSLNIAEETNNWRQISIELNGIALIYGYKGDVDLQLEYLHKSLAILLSKQVDNTEGHIIVLGNIGRVYQSKGDSDNALQNFQKAVVLAEEFGNPQLIGLQLTFLIYYHLIRNEPENRFEVQSYLDRLGALQQNNDDKVINLYYDLCSARFLKNSSRNRDKVEAESLFRKIVNGENRNFEIKILAIYELLELLIFEYKTYKEDEVLDEVHSYLSEIYEITQEKHMFPMLVSCLILRSKLKIVEGALEGGLKYLEQAILTAEEKGLTMWLEQALTEKSKITQEYQEMKKLIENNVSLSERMDKIAVLDYLKIAQKISV
ncbi:MAG: hypothetical protein HeimC2_28510 [Candidatus Heimdallarchaeota archaeon LC_2]|nr:MAG: hypothetical protein HeimC2_28510 [Candidatus Heimdallarchaeota archaeon LC_2]